MADRRMTTGEVVDLDNLTLHQLFPGAPFFFKWEDIAPGYVEGMKDDLTRDWFMPPLIQKSKRTGALELVVFLRWRARANIGQARKIGDGKIKSTTVRPSPPAGQSGLQTGWRTTDTTRPLWRSSV